jgi:hypothetical protein
LSPLKKLTDFELSIFPSAIDNGDATFAQFLYVGNRSEVSRLTKRLTRGTHGVRL